MDLFTNDNEEIIAHQEMITQLRTRIESILKNYRPVMNGEIYLSGEDVQAAPYQQTDFTAIP
jgi:hypothetical protein